MRQRERSQQVWGKWRKVVSEQARSGQSVVGFCRERGLCAPHFFAWKKRLREAAGGEFVEVQVVPSGWREGGATREARAASVSRPAGEARVEVLLKNGRSLWVGRGFDAELVRALMAVVESVG